MNALATIINGDCLDELKKLPDSSIDCCVTSPPYWGLRDYGVVGQIGHEQSLIHYVRKLTKVFRQVHRVLRDEGTVWLNLGDTYASDGGPGWQGKNGCRSDRRFTLIRDTVPMRKLGRRPPDRLKPKDLCGVPWRVAFALQSNGWHLRQDIIWNKPNPMPESVKDRCTRAHEYIFLLSKSRRYYYDQDAIAERASLAMEKQMLEGYQGSATKDFAAVKAQNASETKRRIIQGKWSRMHKNASDRRLVESVANARAVGADHDLTFGITRNKRSVWTVTAQPYKDSHFATFPEDLIKPCILAGCPAGGTVLDPFAGSGTTGKVALELGRSAVLIELNPEYIKLIHRRTSVTPGML